MLSCVALWAAAACLAPAARPLRPLPYSGVLKYASLRDGSRQGSRCRLLAMTHVGPVGKGFGGGEATRDPAPTACDAAVPVASPAPSSVRRHDYSCIDNGQPFVAPGWLSEELLNALRADARQLLDAGRFVDAEENLGKRIKLSLDEEDWTAPGEAAGQPSPARAEVRLLFDDLLLELEAVLGRGRLSLDVHGAQAKYSFGKQGEPG
jgi:hypothetical protein